MHNTSIDHASGRKTLLERLASLRIQPNSNSTTTRAVNTATKAPESPRYIPRSTQSTQAKFYSNAGDSSDLLSSPSIGRRRKLQTNLSSSSSSTSASLSTAKTVPANSPIDSPKYFPKQKVFDELEKVSSLKFPPIAELVNNLQRQDVSELGDNVRRHSATEVVTSFIDSFSILNNSLTSTASKLQLQNMNSSFAALQMDLKAAVSTIFDLRSQSNNIEKNEDIAIASGADLESKIKNEELEEQLKIALSQISEIKLALEKEKVLVNNIFLRFYMSSLGKCRVFTKLHGRSDTIKGRRGSKDLGT